jgi:hypothetical protein
MTVVQELAVLSSQFAVHGSQFAVLNDCRYWRTNGTLAFGVWRLAFGVRRSALMGHRDLW